MKKGRVMVGIFSVAVALGLLIFGVCGVQAQETGTLKIGMITSMTGPFAPGFKGLYDAVKPTEQLVNERGGVTVGGKKYLIKIVVEDDQSSVDGTIAATNKLLQDGIQFIIAPIFMIGYKAMTSIVQDAQVIRIEPMTGDPTLSGPKSFIAIMTGYYIPAVYERLQTKYPKVKKIALVMPDDPGVYSIRDLELKEIQKRSLEVVFNETFQIGTQDFYPLLTKALEKKPDAIECVATIVPWAAGVINGARELGFRGPIFCGTPFGDIHQLKDFVKPEFAYDIFNGSPDVLSDNMTPIIKELRALIMKELKVPMSMENSLCLGALYPLLQVLEKANSFDIEKVVNTWENMESIDTIFGMGKMAGEKLVGIKRCVKGPTPISWIQGGVVGGELIEN